MRLNEFTGPDYENMSEEELTRALDESLQRMSNVIDRSNQRIENESRLDNSRSVPALFRPR